MSTYSLITSWLLSFITALLIVTESPAQEVSTSNNETPWSFQVGHIYGDLKSRNNGDLNMVITMLRFGFPLNEKLGLDDHKGKVTLFLEPIAGGGWKPDDGILIGVPIFLEYSYPLSKNFSVHTGFGAGPSYFGIDTVEEGSGGFEFFDSASAGFRYQVAENHFLNLEYRAIHISDLSISKPNNGINAHGFFIGYSNRF